MEEADAGHGEIAAPWCFIEPWQEFVGVAGTLVVKSWSWASWLEPLAGTFRTMPFLV